MTNAPEEYQSTHNIRFTDKLGDGKDGSVFKTTEGTAVKFFHDSTIYRRERYAYFILQQNEIFKIDDFFVPSLIRDDDDLLAIEMTIVRPPFILDFASAYTEEEVERFEFTEDVIDERQAHWIEIFGERWPIVQAACGAFTDATGLVLLDLTLNNIKFE